ncbi:MAG: phage DNA packaging protein J [Arenicella sp.]|nr:phage DNA packaging protein J [Arenicella sp.]
MIERWQPIRGTDGYRHGVRCWHPDRANWSCHCAVSTGSAPVLHPNGRPAWLASCIRLQGSLPRVPMLPEPE